jgi:hypothetical protein
MNVPKELVDQIARCQCVVFVGAGLSQGAGLPGWPELLQQMLDWSEKRGVDMADRTELESYIEDGDLLLVAEEMHERLGKDNFRSFMAEVFRRPGLKPSDTHMLLPEIPFTAALTSNYDTLLESAYTLTQRGTAPHVFTHSDYPELAAALRSGEFYVLKVHGTIDRIQTIVLGRSDYREVMYANPAYRQHLAVLFSVKTVLFLGFGLTDPDLLSLLEELRIAFRDHTGKHYALMDTRDVPAIKQRRFERDYGIQIIPYTPSAPDHPEVQMFLTSLVEQVCQAWATISQVGWKAPTPLEELATEVRARLQAIRYKVDEPQRLDEHTMSMVVEESASSSERPLHMHITLNRSGDQERDIQRLGQVHALLQQYKGGDRFSLYLADERKRLQIDFPQDTTGWCLELEMALIQMLGAGAVRVSQAFPTQTEQQASIESF